MLMNCRLNNEIGFCVDWVMIMHRVLIRDFVVDLLFIDCCRRGEVDHEILRVCTLYLPHSKQCHE